MFVLQCEHSVHLIEVFRPHGHPLPQVDQTLANVGSLLTIDLPLEFPVVVGGLAPQAICIIELLVFLLVTSNWICTSVKVIRKRLVEVITLRPVDVYQFLYLIKGHSHFLKLFSGCSLSIISKKGLDESLLVLVLLTIDHITDNLSHNVHWH